GETTCRDIKFGLRMLRKNPGFTAGVVLSLTLGIAANSTIFSFVNALLLRPPPVDQPDELWQIWRHRPRAASDLERYRVTSRPHLAYLRSQNHSFAAFGAFSAEPTSTSWNHDELGESVQSQFVSGNFFEVCGIRPVRGRVFLPGEDQAPGTEPTVVVSHKFW